MLYTDEPDFQADSVAVLRRDIPWDIYQTARLITDRDLQLLRRFDKKEASYQAKLLEESGPSYIEAFLTVLKNVTKDETVQYVLALLEEMLAADSGRAQLFHVLSTTGPGGALDAYQILLRLLHRNDWFTQEKACLLLTAVLESRPNKADLRVAAASQDGPSTSSGVVVAAEVAAAPSNAGAEEVHKAAAAFVDWLCAQLRRPSDPSRSVPTAVHALSQLLREPPLRVMLHRAGGVQLLAPLVTMPAPGGPQQMNIQLLYEAALCCWELSFYRPAADVLCGSTNVVGALVDVVRLAQKEKLVRVALMALKNLISVGPMSLEYAVVEKGLPKAVSNRALQHWDDSDIPDLLSWMEDHLQEGIATLSSFERYKKELLGGQLTWAPMHESDAFWRENAEKLVENNCQLLRVLLKLLETSRDSTTLAVGCLDVAQFVSHVSHGRGIVTELRGKELVMRLMMHPDPDVQSQALKCVQKVLLSRDKADFLSV
ncbi:V-type proton ATPase subunit H-like [Micractinium conductrix]|uniref:V-type proton ATPase subunit H n=1 Tax=Micractinium conductrix TaxID=554055 RepID=A0A2P6VQS3_9CHLO|nr:V-type proton ATPase subunit H-like [Micractinium conductrix]|eukprot:PSC76439.1 V-type proton ATPase subunit H-like [Micractinium conductrix]